MAAYYYCKFCKKDFREDSSHEYHGCPTLRNNPALKRQAERDDIIEDIKHLEMKIVRLKKRLADLA